MAGPFDDVEVPAGMAVPAGVPSGAGPFDDVEVPGRPAQAFTQSVTALPPQAPALERYLRYGIGGPLAGIAQGVMGPEAAIGNYFFPSERWPTPERIAAFSRNLFGLGDVTMRPSPGPEAIGLAGLQGAGAAAPMALAGGGPGGVIARTALGTLTGGIAGGAEETAREAGYANPAAIGGALGLVTGGVIGAGARAGEAALGQINPRSAALVQAGVPLSSAAITSESGMTRRLLAPSMPREQIQSDIGGAIEAAASSLSPRNPRTWDQAGDYAQTRVRQWLTAPAIDPTGFLGRQAQAWSLLDSVMPRVPTPRSNLDAAIAQLATKPGPNQAIEEILGPRTADRLQSASQSQQALAALTGSATPIPTWEQMHRTRQIIGDALANPTIAPDLSASQKDTLYRAVTQDMQGAAYRQGLHSEFDKANMESNNLNQFRRNVLSKIVSSDTGARETIPTDKAAKNVLATLRSGDTTISQLRQNGLGDVADDMAALHLRLSGLEDPANQTSPVAKGWPGAWQGLTKAGVHDDLIPDPTTRANLETLSGLTRQTYSPPAPGGLAHAAVPFIGLEAGREVGGLIGHMAHFAGQDLLPEELGAVVGAGIPLAYYMARDPVSRSVLAARYAATPRIGNLTSQAASAATGAVSGLNPLVPSPQTGNQLSP